MSELVQDIILGKEYFFPLKPAGYCKFMPSTMPEEPRLVPWSSPSSSSAQPPAWRRPRGWTEHQSGMATGKCHNRSEEPSPALESPVLRDEPGETRLPTPMPAEEPTPPAELLRMFHSPNSLTRLRMGSFGREGGPTVMSFTSPAAFDTTMPSSSSSAPQSGVELFSITISVPASGATADDDEPREIHAVEPPLQPPTQPPRHGARMRVGGRGRLSGRLAPRMVEQTPSTPPRSSEFIVLTGAETAGTSAPGSFEVGPLTIASPHTPNRGPLLCRHAHLAGTPPRRPGREAAAWAATARLEPRSNGVLHLEDPPSR
ncbi:hypothetical protein PR202_ga21272 [Eleusine coracana subsp. coracana]|uniref:Uncharacterized protein n=1 Tax=Eleusine coracana subsp. coracana TaxID=191504 RepID=A0AAV5CYQ4_ELECO|nr:hypothetical protein PR202_ga21272 [Eleusine coracana subsp. coracana]